MRGIFCKKPSKPKYDEVYSLEPVLSMLEKMYPLEHLSLQELNLSFN